MHRIKSLTEEWTQRTEGVSLGGFFDLPHKGPTFVAIFPLSGQQKMAN